MKQPASPKSKTNLSQLAQRPINEDIVFGIDVGIASCGWAVVDTKNEAILAMGSRCFEPPEDPQKKTLYNEQRRTKRGMRRVTSRRSGRMNSVRRIIKDAGLVDTPTHKYFQSLGKHAPDPWETRALAVEESIAPEEAAVALIHIAKHRGFKSNSKRDAADTDGRDVLSAVEDWDKTRGERTYAQAVIDKTSGTDQPDRRRNKAGRYEFTPPRQMLYEEASQIIQTQRALGSEWATEKFEKNYLEVAFHQRELKSSEKFVGNCPFESDEKRAAKFSYSFEMFRLLEKLVHTCKLSTPHGERSLTPKELKLAVANFGKQKSITYTKLRRLIDLPDDHRFVGAPNPENEKKDVFGVSTGAAEGSYILFRSLSSSDWNQLVKTPRILDSIAAIITFNESPDKIRDGLESLPLETETIDSLMENLEAGKFSRFKGTGKISAKAARKLIPGMLSGNTYDKACDEVGYDFNKGIDTSIQDIRNPVVQRALTQVVKQVAVLVRCYGRPSKIYVELMRDVGKSADERGEIERGIKKRTDERDKNRQEFLDCVKAKTCTRDDLLKYELLKQQNFDCAYCEEHPLRPHHILRGDVQVDHIYPRSRSHEDGFVNKVATCISCNQDKQDRTPWKWRGQHNPDWWAEFSARVKNFTCNTEKKRRLQSKSFEDRRQHFIERNKIDNSYVSRALLREVRKLYPNSYSGGAVLPGSHRHIFPRPGQLTAMLRYVWLSAVKYKKDRDDDRHHAMDALIVAMINECLFQQLTDTYKQLETLGKQHKTTPNIDPPWESFAQDAMNAYNAGWLVCRTENRRARGALHEETIRTSRINENGSQVFYERKAIENITKYDVSRIPDPIIRERVASWLEDGKSDENRPCSAKGDPIRKLRLPTKIKTATQINCSDMGGKDSRKQGGYAENSNMVRVDLFKVNETKYDINGRRITRGYYLVPIYLWQVRDNNSKTPLKAIVANRSEAEWPEMHPGDFVMSLYKDSYIEFVRNNGQPVAGYYRSTGRATASISVSPHDKRQLNDMIQSIGVKGLGTVIKFQVDRLGIKREIPAGSERWPGYQYDHERGA